MFHGYLNRSKGLTCLLLCFMTVGCTTPTVIKYTSFSDSSFPTRPTAKWEDATVEQVIKEDYLLIGHLDYQKKIRICYTDNYCRRVAEQSYQHEDILQEAAKKGGDIVTVLHEDTQLEKVSESYCSNYYTSTYVDADGNTHYMTTCSSYYTQTGYLEKKLVKALVWRYDPALSKSKSNIIATQKALEFFQNSNKKENKIKSEDIVDRSLQRNHIQHEVAVIKDKQILHRFFATSPSQIERLVNREDLTNWKSTDGRNLLSYSILSEEYDYIPPLLKLNISCSNVDEYGYTAWDYAQIKLKLTTLKKMYNSKQCGVPDLFLVLYNNDLNVLKWALNNWSYNINKLEDGITPLMTTIREGNQNATLFLIKKGADISQAGSSGITPLLVAIYTGNKELMSLLLKRGANLSTKDNKGNTALHIAAAGGHLPIVKVLQQKGFMTTEKNNEGQTPFQLAVLYDQQNVIDYFFLKDILKSLSYDNMADLLATAIYRDNAPLVKSILSEVLSRENNEKLYTEIVHIFYKRTLELGGAKTIKMLANKTGAGLNKPLSDGKTPLMVAVNNNNLEAISTLLQLGSNPSIKDNNGMTALMQATRDGQLEVVKLMRQHSVAE